MVFLEGKTTASRAFSYVVAIAIPLFFPPQNE